MSKLLLVFGVALVAGALIWSSSTTLTTKDVIPEEYAASLASSSSPSTRNTPLHQRRPSDSLSFTPAPLRLKYLDHGNHSILRLDLGGVRFSLPHSEIR
jgi:hypothetical protein